MLIFILGGLCAAAGAALLVYLFGRFRATALDPIALSESLEKWRKVTTVEDGTRIYLFRKRGVKALLVYLGEGSDWKREIDPASSRIRNSGYNLLSAVETSTIDPQQREGHVRSVIQYALNRPGLEEKIFLVHGSRLGPALRMLRETPVSGLIFYHPGDAPVEDPALRSLVASIPATTPVLWIGSGVFPEQARADYLSWFARGEIHKIRSAELFPAQQDSPDESIDRFFDFLLLCRLHIRWENAQHVFARGCSIYPDGTGKIGLNRFQVSARRDIAFCPLFLRSPGGLHRVRQVTDHGCEYTGGPYFWRLFCMYE